jgi:hypothetical protein
MAIETPLRPEGTPEAVEEIDVRKLRQGFELNQAEFALMGAMALRTLQGWESGRSEPSGTHLKTLREFAKLLAALRRYWEPGTLGRWLRCPNQLWAGHRPLDLIREGHLDMVWRLIYALGDGDMS